MNSRLHLGEILMDDQKAPAFLGADKMCVLLIVSPTQALQVQLLTKLWAQEQRFNNKMQHESLEVTFFFCSLQTKNKASR